MTPTLNPRRISIDDLQDIANLNGDQIHIQRPLDSTAAIECVGRLKMGSKHLVCLLPSAQQGSSARVNPVFHRWSWAYNLKDTHVLSFSDPSLFYSPLHAAWFSSPTTVDIINAMADFIQEIATRLKVDTNHILLYGSSMGGFGALMLGSHLTGSMVIAEVPQIDLRKYPIPSAIASLEHNYYNKQSISDYYEVYSHRIDVMDRFLLTKHVPSIKIITNTADTAHAEHSSFIEDLNKKRFAFNQFGDISIIHRSDAIGHKPLTTPTAIRYIEATLLESWGHSINQATPYTSPSKSVEILKPDYKTTLDKAIAVSAQIKFTRTPSDLANYELAKSLLLEAADIRREADWPYLKLCSLIKLWTNSFNNELLEAAEKALSRKASLEAFIYACRGTAYNNTPLIALDRIKQLQESCTDPEVANVANIFIGNIQYELNNFEGYEASIEIFRKKKSPGFNPYIAIPVSTVLTNTTPLNSSSNQINISLFSKPLEYADVNSDQLKYLVSTSCDLNYLEKYGEFLVKSFTKSCSHEAAIHLSITSGDIETVRTRIEEWGGKNVYFTIQNIECKINEAPIASLLRFISLPHLIDSHKVPVFVLDLDTAVTSSLLPVVQKYEGSDICSRILGYGVAPWEKYTGGFALFYPTEPSIAVAHSIAKAGELLSSESEKQWWIDQNCFEAGIRHNMKSGINPKIVDFSTIRSSCCTMPVGNEGSKLFQLRKALEGMGIHSVQP